MAASRLPSRRVTEGFRAYVLEQLAGIGGVRANAMFGGVGLYAEDTFFGLIAADAVYLKVDDDSRGRYQTEGMQAFQPYADRPSSMNYFQVPARVLEDADELAVWATASVRAARSARRAGRPTSGARKRRFADPS